MSLPAHKLPPSTKLSSPSMFVFSLNRSFNFAFTAYSAHSSHSWFFFVRPCTRYHSFHTSTLSLFISIPLSLSPALSFICLSAVFVKHTLWQTTAHLLSSFSFSSLLYPVQPLIFHSIITFCLFSLPLFPVLLIPLSLSLVLTLCHPLQTLTFHLSPLSSTGPIIIFIAPSISRILSLCLCTFHLLLIFLLVINIWWQSDGPTAKTDYALQGRNIRLPFSSTLSPTQLIFTSALLACKLTYYIPWNIIYIR